MKKIFLTLLFPALLFLAAMTISAVAQDLPNFEETIAKLGSQDVGERERAHNTWQKVNMRAGGDAELRKAVNKAATEALAGDLPVEARVELLQQLQWTGTNAEVDIITEQIYSQEYTVRDEAIRCLQKIGGKGIESLKKVLDGSKANAQDKKIIQDVLSQLNPNVSIPKETDMPFGLANADAKTVEDWMKNYNNLSMEQKIRTLTALTARGDRKYTSVAVAAAKMQPENDDEMAKLLKKAGLMAMEKLATKNEVPLLVDLAVDYEYGFTQHVVSGIQTEGFDEALLNAMGTTTDGRRIGAISEMLARRNSGAGVDQILEEAKSPDCKDRVSMFTNAVAVAGNDRINDLLDILAMIPAGADREKAEKLIVGRCNGNSQQVRDRIGRGQPGEWFALLGRIGDNGAWDVLNDAVQKPELRDAAVRGLCNFPHARHADALMAIVDNEDKKFSDDNRLAAIRAYIRVVSLPADNEKNMSGEQLAKMYAEKLAALSVAMEKSWRDEERKLILSRLSAIRDVESAKFAYEFVKNDSLREDAYKALADLAHHNNIRRPNKDYFIPVLDEIIAKCRDKAVVERCKGYRNLMD